MTKRPGMLCLGSYMVLLLAMITGMYTSPVYGESFTAEAATSRAVASKLVNAEYSEVCDLTAPEFIKLASEGDQINVSWSPVEGAGAYRVLLMAEAEDLVDEGKLAEEDNQWEEITGTSCSFKKLERGYYQIAVMATSLELDDWDYGIYHHSLITCSDLIYVEGYDFYLTSLKQTALDEATLKWESYSDCKKLQILRSKTKTGDYEIVKTISDPSADSQTCKIPEIGKTFYYRMVAKDDDDQVIGVSDIRSLKGKVFKPVITAATNSATAIRISWGSFMPGLAGYEIRYATAEEGPFKLLKRVTNSEKSSYLNSGLAVKETRYYKARVYTLDGEGKRVYSKYSDVVKATAKLKQVKITEVEALDETSIYLAWNKVAGATGYQIWGKTSDADSFKKLKTLSNNTDLNVCLTGLKDGYTHSIKVRAYKKTEDATYYGSYSSVKSVTLKKLSPPASVNVSSESKAAKCMRVFGTSEIVRYSSKEAAQKDMVKIQVKCWDFKDSSKTSKITKTYTIEVHNKVASDVKAVFEEIYNGPEMFPIHDVGGFSWRGDSSSSEHNLGLAIDINPDENYFYNFNTDTILCGKYWKPGEDPYSIPEYGDVENAFIRHGFTRGRWSTKVDYMHFSFFGT